MNEQNLIPSNQRTPEERREIARKGGLSKSPKKKLAAQLRRLREKGLTDETSKKIYQIMTDPDFTDLESLMLILGMRKEGNTIKEKESIAKLLLEWRKTRHGAQIRIDQRSQNLNVNLNATLDTARILELAKEE